MSPVKTVFGVALFALSCVVSGCAPEYERLEISGVVKSSLPGDITTQRIEVPVGMILKAHIVPFNDDGDSMSGQVTSADPKIMDVAAVVSDRDFAFIGVKTGKTEIQIRADDKIVLRIEAVVTDQPASP